MELFFVNNQHIYELWGWVGPQPPFDGWHPNDITKLEEVFFVNSDGTIQQLTSPTTTQPTWTTTNLFSGAARAPVPADPQSPLIITFDSLTNPHIEELYYVGVDRGIHKLQSVQPGKWSATP